MHVRLRNEFSFFFSPFHVFVILASCFMSPCSHVRQKDQSWNRLKHFYVCQVGYYINDFTFSLFSCFCHFFFFPSQLSRQKVRYDRLHKTNYIFFYFLDNSALPLLCMLPRWKSQIWKVFIFPFYFWRGLSDYQTHLTIFQFSSSPTLSLAFFSSDRL